MRKLVNHFDTSVFKFLLRLAYPACSVNPASIKNYQVLFRYFVWQKLFRVNAKVPWPVDFRSKLVAWENIKKGIHCNPGDSLGNYINAEGGLLFGDNVELGPNVTIATVNHQIGNVHAKGKRQGVEIGSNVWIGANAVITAGVTIGDNVVIGAGCVIRQNIPSNTLVKHANDALSLVTIEFEKK